jgi:hypothetical protein
MLKIKRMRHSPNIQDILTVTLVRYSYVVQTAAHVVRNNETHSASDDARGGEITALLRPAALWPSRTLVPLEASVIWLSPIHWTTGAVPTRKDFLNMFLHAVIL